MYILLCTSFGLAATAASLLRLNFNYLKSFTSSTDTLRPQQIEFAAKTNSLFPLFLITHSFILFLFPFDIYTSFNINEGLVYLITLAVLALSILLFSQSTVVNYITHPFITLFLFTNLLLPACNNLIHFYLLLEVITYTNLLLLTIYGVTARHTQSAREVKAVLIAFLLNFITSILMYGFILDITWVVGYLPFYMLPTILNPNEQHLLLLIILMKVGCGPWVLGNVVSYQGYPFSYLLVYTITSLSTLSPLLLQLLTWGRNPVLVLVSVTYLLYLLLINTFNTTTLKNLFAYSTSIVHAYLLLIITL